MAFVKKKQALSFKTITKLPSSVVASEASDFSVQIECPGESEANVFSSSNVPQVLYTCYSVIQVRDA